MRDFINAAKRLNETTEHLLDVPTPSAAALAKKYGVTEEEVTEEINRGIEVELEHTTDRKIAREIACDHLSEKLDYYELLAKVEKE